VSRITPESVESVRQAADIAEVVSGYTDLRQRGARHLGLCPFHDERTPSFSVDSGEGLYYCFGCQAGGDVFGFLMEKEGLEFREAVEQLADRYGVELAFDTQDPGEDQRRRGRERLLELLAKTAEFYQRYLWESDEGKAARTYLEGRGLQRPALEEFGVGFAPSAWDRLLVRAQKGGFSVRELHDAGLAQRGRNGGTYDRFRGRIMFPLRNTRGRVLGFGARALRDDQQPKYVNSPETPVYRKGRSLFGIDLARQHATRSGRVIVVEGYTDVIALHQAGIRNTVASMGTALTEEQVAELARLARTVLLAFDADRSGRDAMLRAQRAAQGRGVDLKVIPLPDDKDPCDLLLGEGSEGFVDRERRAVSFLQFQVESAMEGANVSSAADKDRLIAELGPVFADAEASAERDEQIRKVASRLALSEHLLEPLLARPRTAAPIARDSSAPPRRGAAARGERGERIFLAMCVSSGAQGRAYLERLEDGHFSSELLRRARTWLFEHFGAPTAGLPRDDEQLAQVVSEVVVRASTEPASETALEIGFLELERPRLEREIRAAGEAEDFERQRELATRRVEAIARIARLMGEEDRQRSSRSTT
jgi:DNA primase